MMNQNRITFLDGLRGLLATQVAISHFFNFTLQRSESSSSFTNLLLNNNLSVKLFFILSGFALTHSFLVKGDLHKQKDFLKKQFFIRYFRLTIPLFLTLLIFYIISLTNLHPPTTQINENLKNYAYFTFSLKDWFSQSFILILNKNFKFVNPVYWTIGIEIIGSYLLFFLLKNYKDKKIISYFIAAILLILSLKYSLYILLILLGAIFRIFDPKYALSKMKIGILLSLSLVLISYNGEIFLFKYFNTLENHLDSYHLISSMGCLLLFLSFTKSLKLQTLLNQVVFIKLGEISYMLYLTHFSIIYLISTRLVVDFALHTNFLISFTFMLLIAAFTHYFLEKPFLNSLHNYANKFLNKLNNRSLNFKS